MANPMPLQWGQTFHIYNRGNNRECIFTEETDYRHFLELYTQHVHPIANTYAYCLLPNHFHFLLHIRNLSGSRSPSQSISNLCNAYAKSFNNRYARRGALFERPFGRIAVSSDDYFTHLIMYIHHNPQKHGWVDDFRSWPHSSYPSFLSQEPTKLDRKEVLGWFGGLEAFIDCHKREDTIDILSQFVGDDEYEPVRSN